MFSNQYTFYKKESILDHSKDGGPRCYHEFKYKGNRIILIGECHSTLPLIIGKQYQYIINQFVYGNRDNEKTKIYVERRPDYDKTPNRVSIRNIFANISNNENVKIINADERIIDKGDCMFWSILEILITTAIKKKLNFSKDKEKINQAWNKIISTFKEKNVQFQITLNDYEELLKNQIIKIKNLLDDPEKNNHHLYRFLCMCYTMINSSLENFNQLKKEYSLLYPDEDGGQQHLDEICIKMMNAEGSLLPAIRWYTSMRPYFTYSLDGTLACKLWDDMDREETQTLIVVVGSAHAEDLVLYLGSFCKSICSIPLKSNNEASIRPDELQACLDGEVLKNENNNTCCMM